MSGPHWLWPTGFQLKFHAEPMQTRVPGALTNEFGIMVRRRDRDSVAFARRAGAAWPAVAFPPSGISRSADDRRAGPDRVGRLNDLEGGFFVLGNHARRHLAEDWSQIVHEVRGKIRKAVAGRMYAKQH
jgi:hypothetical protein